MNIQRKLTKKDLRDLLAIFLIFVGGLWIYQTPWSAIGGEAGGIIFFFVAVPGVLIFLGGISLLSAFDTFLHRLPIEQGTDNAVAIRTVTLGMAGVFLFIPFMLFVSAVTLVVVVGMVQRESFRQLIIEGFTLYPVMISLLILVGVAVVGLWIAIWIFRQKQRLKIAQDAVHGLPRVRSMKKYQIALIVIFLIVYAISQYWM